MILSIDPSLRAMGWCLWKDGKPITYGLVTPRREFKDDSWQHRIRHMVTILEHDTQKFRRDPEAVISEQPQVFHSERGQAARNNESIQRLYQMVGFIHGRCTDSWDSPMYFVRPNRWKGTVPKEITQKRMQRRYNIPKDLDHNIVDAIGIGDWFIRKSKAQL